jgi:hypothetical protein
VEIIECNIEGTLKYGVNLLAACIEGKFLLIGHISTFFFG